MAGTYDPKDSAMSFNRIDDHQWRQIAPLLPAGEQSQSGEREDPRQAVDALLWRDHEEAGGGGLPD